MDGAESSTWTAQNGAITEVKDRSKSGYTLTQTNPSSRPGLSSSKRNGRNYFEFTVGQPVTLFAVVRNGASVGNILNRQIIGNAVSPNASPALYVSNGVWRQSAGTEHVSSTSVDQNWHYLSAIYNGSTSRLYLDGVLILDSSANANPGTNSWLSSPFVIGSRGTGEFGWIGDIAEVMMFGSALDDASRQHTEKYLAGKWGFTQ
jgi:hypothetical protein